MLNWRHTQGLVGEGSGMGGAGAGHRVPPWTQGLGLTGGREPALPAPPGSPGREAVSRTVNRGGGARSPGRGGEQSYEDQGC